MATPILTWLLIVCILAAFFITHAVLVGIKRHHRVHAPHHVIEFGSESDEFFVPGDSIADDCDTFNSDDN